MGLHGARMLKNREKAVIVAEVLQDRKRVLAHANVRTKRKSSVDQLFLRIQSVRVNADNFRTALKSSKHMRYHVSFL